MRGYSWFSWMMPSLKTPFDVFIEFDSKNQGSSKTNTYEVGTLWFILACNIWGSLCPLGSWGEPLGGVAAWVGNRKEFGLYVPKGEGNTPPVPGVEFISVVGDTIDCWLKPGR